MARSSVRCVVMRTNPRRLLPALAVAAALLVSVAPAANAQSKPVTLRLGYFPNLTHASAVVGVEKRTSTKTLPQHSLSGRTAPAGPEAVEPPPSGAPAATAAGPSPAINRWGRSTTIARSEAVTPPPI